MLQGFIWLKLYIKSFNTTTIIIKKYQRLVTEIKVEQSLFYIYYHALLHVQSSMECKWTLFIERVTTARNYYNVFVLYNIL